MKTDHQVPWLVLLLALLTGCAGTPSEKPIVSRGWVGGEFARAEKRLRPPQSPARVYVKRVYPGTPAAAAGLREGDLILAVDGREVPDERALHDQVDAASPGTELRFEVLRAGERSAVGVVVGRERYRVYGFVRLGLGFSSQFDLLPNPEFSVLPAVAFQRPRERVELMAPESVLARQRQAGTATADQGELSREGWDLTLAILGFGQHKRILAQELVEPVRAMGTLERLGLAAATACRPGPRQ